VDVNEEKLEAITQVVKKIISAGKYPAKVTGTTKHQDALKDADGVLITVAVGSRMSAHMDLEIPMKYGVDICVGDTRGPGGIFRFLRTLPVMLDICKDIEKYAPDAVVLNYTNPMAMLCRALQEKTRLNITGLCHSVQGTSEMLAEWIGAPIEEITYTCAGINHQAHYLEFKWKGRDAYPLIREALKRPEIYNAEPVRNEMFRHLGYYVTESSGHASEYNAWFRKRPDLMKKYCTNGTNWNPGLHEMGTDFSKGRNWKEEFFEWMDEDKIDLKRGHEYASNIFNAIFGDNTPFVFNGNVRNFGIIENLPYGCCVEVPTLASQNGIQKIHVGALPDQLAIINTQNALCEELAVKGFFEKDRTKIFHAICMDPLTSAVCSLEEIKNMTEEMFEENKEFLPYF
jgi:Alpha-galactosidases/6-phospho-beta-glucosidases, family 4 of glycosyl hydrolases